MGELSTMYLIIPKTERLTKKYVLYKMWLSLFLLLQNFRSNEYFHSSVFFCV
jgi:hypothetical protein